MIGEHRHRYSMCILILHQLLSMYNVLKLAQYYSGIRSSANLYSTIHNIQQKFPEEYNCGCTLNWYCERYLL